MDIKIVYTGLRLGEKLYKEKLMTEEGLTKTENDLIHIGKPFTFDTDTFLVQLRKLMYLFYSNKADINSQEEKMVSIYHPTGERGSTMKDKTKILNEIPVRHRGMREAGFTVLNGNDEYIR